MFQEVSQDLILNMKAPVLIAGLVGAFITLLRKSEGTIQARAVGFCIAIATTMFITPIILWGLIYKFGIVPSPIEIGASFIFGMVSQRLGESFIDNPMQTVVIWVDRCHQIVTLVWGNNETKIKEIVEKEKENDT